MFKEMRCNEVAAVTGLRYRDIKQVKQEKQHDNEIERGQNTHSKWEWVKIPLFPNDVGKRRGTDNRVTTVGEYHKDIYDTPFKNDVIQF